MTGRAYHHLCGPAPPGWYDVLLQVTLCIPSGFYKRFPAFHSQLEITLLYSWVERSMWGCLMCGYFFRNCPKKLAYLPEKPMSKTVPFCLYQHSDNRMLQSLLKVWFRRLQCQFFLGNESTMPISGYTSLQCTTKLDHLS